MSVLAHQLGAQLAVLWALSSDGAFFVAEASAGPRQSALRPGAALPAALGDHRHNSLQRIQASKASTTYTCVDPESLQMNLHGACQARAHALMAGADEGSSSGGGGPQPFGKLPYDLAELAERCSTAGGAGGGGWEGMTGGGVASVTDFAVLPLVSGGAVVGAVTLAMHRGCLPPQHRGSHECSGAGATDMPRSPAAKPDEQLLLPAPPPLMPLDFPKLPDGFGANDDGNRLDGIDRSGSKQRLMLAAAAGPLAAATSAAAYGTAAAHGVEPSGTSLTNRIRRAFSRTDKGDQSAGAKAASRAAGAARDTPLSPGRVPLPASFWLHSAACVYQLSQLAHFLGYGFFSDAEQSSFVAQCCSLVSGVAVAPDMQALVNCLIGMTTGIIYQRFRLQAHVLVALVHSSGTTAAYLKQQRQPRASIARTVAAHPSGVAAGAYGGGSGHGGSRYPLAGVGVGGMAGVGLYGGGSGLAGGRAHSQRDMSSQQRLYTLGGYTAAAAAAAAAQALYGSGGGAGAGGGAGQGGGGGGGGSGVGNGVGDVPMAPAMQALHQANLSNASAGGDGSPSPTGGNGGTSATGAGGVAGNTAATAPIHGGGGGPGTGGGGGRGGGVSGGLFNLSAALLGRKTRSQSQLRSARSVPLQSDAQDGIVGYASETSGQTSVTATIISLSHTLLADALAASPPAGTAVLSCAEALARDAAPIRDISLASRLVADVGLPGPAIALPTDESVIATGTYSLSGGGGGTGMLSPSTSFLRCGSACGVGTGTAGSGRHAPLGSLVIALGLGCSGRSVSNGVSPAGFGGFSGTIPPAAGLSGVSNNRMSVGRGNGRPSNSSNYPSLYGGGGGQYQQGPGQGPPQRTSAASTGLGAVSGMLVGPMGGHPVSGCIEESGETNVQAGLAVGLGGPTQGAAGQPGQQLPASEPYLALYVAFREVLQEPVLDKLLQETTQMVELVTPSVQQRLLTGLRHEWAAMHSRLLNPAAFIGGQSLLSAAGGGLSAALGPGGGSVAVGGACPAPSASNSRLGRQPNSHDWTEALVTGELWQGCGGGSGPLSFALEEPAPLSHLQVLVNSFHSTLSSIQVIPTAEGGGGAGPGDRDVAYERDKPEAVQRAARRQRALLRDALEVAASAALSHPNLVQLHTYFTDVMVVEYQGDAPGRYRLMHVAESVPGDPTGAVNLVLVLEYYDGGNLRQAMERGVFFRRDRLPSPAHLPAARAEAAGAGGAAAALAAAAELAPNFEVQLAVLMSAGYKKGTV
ncbi:hypothetical protein HYH02_012485 [Chlamydomonas schloesseri]|uniref:Protein kinase domain-containing protein n=1 Tax=Chlamydomonas schloesseri TaxID=2026947 RepID=A0A835T9C2_9CHLO|nr:hypothetical protein HYH02_012485 [Chlamydomonas schloesseri]|eukprot:KAG2433940.1 hypothetical protein HYH02_012485 [Chlamydomonas schloesseri]